MIVFLFSSPRRRDPCHSILFFTLFEGVFIKCNCGNNVVQTALLVCRTNNSNLNLIVRELLLPSMTHKTKKINREAFLLVLCYIYRRRRAFHPSIYTHVDSKNVREKLYFIRVVIARDTTTFGHVSNCRERMLYTKMAIDHFIFHLSFTKLIFL